MKINNKIISRVYDYRSNWDNTSSVAYNRKLDDSENVIVNTPLNHKTMEYIIKNSSMVRKCSDILSKDILLNNINVEDNEWFTKWLQDNNNDLYMMGIDYYCTGYAVCLILDNNYIQQIPSVSCVVIKENNDYYMKQSLNGKWYYYNIFGVTKNNKYDETVYLLGGDNLYSFYSLPKYYNCKEEVFVDILLSERNFKHIENNLIPSSILHFNLEPNINNDDNIDTISKELKGAEGGTTVLFTESENKQNIDYINLESSNIDDIIKLNGQAERSILNVYNIPLERLLINENKESMNSSKFTNVWEIYIANLKTESRIWLNFLSELLDIKLNDFIVEYPVFSDNKSTELDNIIKLWNNNIIPYDVAINMVREYYTDLDVGLLEDSFKGMLNNEINTTGGGSIGLL